MTRRRSRRPRTAGALATILLAALSGTGAGAAHAADPGAVAARASRFAATHAALGTYFDPVARRQVVVVPRRSPVTEARVARAVGARARVERRSITADTVAAIQHRIAALASDRRHSYASYLDLATGKVVLRTDAPPALTADLSSAFPGLIEPRPGAPRDALSRQADLAPFWGGASIMSGGGICSAGFTVERPSGARFMVTAGHCFELGAGVVTTGGGAGTGSVVRRGPIPPFDMELIGGGLYDASIFVGDDAHWSRKRVTGAADPVVGFPDYCRSGQTTGERCGQTVLSVNGQVCTQTGCKWPVIVYDGGPAGAAAPGDSGAPLYVRSRDGAHVRIRGMHIAQAGTISYAEKWSRIASHLGVRIAVRTAE